MRSMSFDQSAGAYADDNGIKESVATADTAQTYYLADLDGTSTVGKAIATGSHSGFASWPTVKNSAAVGSYVVGSTVRFVGMYGGKLTDRVATLTSADGGATVIADGPLDHGSITKIEVAAQVDNAGAFDFGWTDIGPLSGRGWFVVARAAGSIVVEHFDGLPDTVLLPIHGEHRALVSRIFAAVTIDVCVYDIERP
jgi:hypothetical protein